jgi:GAF domain-containing protein
MSSEPSTATGPIRAAYAAALRDHLRAPAETSLRVAYELAREAVGRRLSVLDLAVAHQEALLAALEGVSDGAEVQRIVRAAGDFLLEGLATYEMVQRGFAEARRAALSERRQTELARQLSAFLADASLALDAENALDEMLQLVAEQACELVDAECCLATVAANGLPRSAEATCHPDGDRRWATFARWLDLEAVYRLVRERGGSARVAGDALAELAPFRRPPGERRPRGWLAAALTTLDATDIGAVQLFDKREGAFTGEDEAALVHLAQMASAAVERAGLYRAPR